MRISDWSSDVCSSDLPLVAQQRLTGPEYTVNVYFNGDGRMRTSVPHERIRVRAGEVEKGVTRRLPRLQHLAQRLAAAHPSHPGTPCPQAFAHANVSAPRFQTHPPPPPRLPLPTTTLAAPHRNRTP